MRWRRVLIGTVAAIALGACGATNGPVGQRLLNTALGEDDFSFDAGRFATLRQAGQGPALDIRVEGSGIRGGFLREAQQGNIATWLGVDGVTLTFDRGILHGTRGIGSGLLASDVSPTARLIRTGGSGQVERIHTFLDGNDLAVSRVYVCDVRAEGSQNVTLDIGTVRTRKTVEFCRNPDTEFTNEYWYDPSRNTIVRSRQWAGEELGMLSIQAVYNF